MSTRRVVVTGMGMVSPLGNNTEDTWKAILNGDSGVSTIDTFETSDLGTRIAAQVKGFDPLQYIEAKETKRIAPFTQYALAATDEAIRQAQFLDHEFDADRVGVAVGSGIGGINTITDGTITAHKNGIKRVSPFFIPASIINIVAGHISMRYKFKGPNISIVTACTTGTHNIGHAFRMIKYGDADVMVAGGTEMATSRLTIAGFGACRALSKRNDEPTRASRPWDKGRDGFVFGEGAAVLMLEEYEYAKKRGAPILAELTGFGMSADAFHVTAPDPSGHGSYTAMKNAIKDGGLAPTDINYINAHATSTPAGDEVEVKAIKNLFGDHANSLPVSSTKSMIGHLLGAAGSIEAAFSILAIRDQVAPPTINLDEPDSGCDLNFVSSGPQEHTINHVLSNSLGFGGTNGAILFSKI